MNKNIIAAENLTFSYAEQPDALSGKVTAAVKNISLEIERGSFTAIIGHNGSGKSTLAKLLSGVLLPDEGKVTIYTGDGRELDCSKEEHNFDIRKTVGMVFQNPDNQLVATIVEDDVAFAPENLGKKPKEIRSLVDNALETVGLSEYALHDTHKLSGGQKQRVAIAGILAMEPECIIFDESTAMLDPRGRMDILDVIHQLKNKGITVVLITHYMNEAALADRVVVVHGGGVVCSGTPDTVFKNSKMLEECALEPPQSTLVTAGISSYLDGQCAISVDEAVEMIEKALDKRGKNKKEQG